MAVMEVVELYTLPGGENYDFSSFGNFNNSTITSFLARSVPDADYLWLALYDGAVTTYTRRLGLFNNTTHALVFSQNYLASVTLLGIGKDGSSVWFEHHAQPSSFYTYKNISTAGVELNSVPGAFGTFELRTRHLYEIDDGIMYVQWDSPTAGRMNVYYTINNGSSWTDQLTRVIPGLSTVEDQQDNWTFAINADRIAGRLYVCGAWSGQGVPFSPTNATIFWLDTATNAITLIREYDRVSRVDAVVGKDGFIYARSRNTGEANLYEKMDQDGTVVDTCVLTGISATDYTLESADENAVIDENGNIVLYVGTSAGAQLWRIRTATMEIDATRTLPANNYRLITGDAFQGWGVLILTHEGTLGPDNIIRVLVDIGIGQPSIFVST